MGSQETRRRGRADGLRKLKNSEIHLGHVSKMDTDLVSEFGMFSEASAPRHRPEDAGDDVTVPVSEKGIFTNGVQAPQNEASQNPGHRPDDAKGTDLERLSETQGKVKGSEKGICTDGGQAPQNSQSAQDCPAVAQGSAAAEEEGATMCTACGHSVQSTLCCKMASQSTRAGERQRQAANRAKRQRELLVEEASRRPRVIPSVEEAVGPAQIAMARLKARLNKRVG